MSNNLKYLKEDFYNSVYFENKFKDNIKIIDVKGTEKLSEIFLKKLNNLLSTNYTIGEIENLHRNIDEDYKIYDQIFAINKISTFFYDMPDSFIQEYFKILKLKVRSVIGEDFYFQKIHIKITNASQNSRANVSFLPFRYSVRTPSL